MRIIDDCTKIKHLFLTIMNNFCIYKVIQKYIILVPLQINSLLRGRVNKSILTCRTAIQVLNNSSFIKCSKMITFNLLEVYIRIREKPLDMVDNQQKKSTSSHLFVQNNTFCCDNFPVNKHF